MKPPLDACDRDPRIPVFVAKVLHEGAVRYRDFPWRHTHDPYEILVSEVMLQQTQATRVVVYYETWLERFPTLDALAVAPLEAVLHSWQGLGYNRRALALKRLAEQLAEAGSAELPRAEADLLALPGIGPATAAGIRAFAYGEPAAYLETNVRSVVLHELFADADDVPDKLIAPLVAQAAQAAEETGATPRTWNYALLDYGTHLKRTLPNPSRRSAHHTRQSRFEGSRRQLRARLLRLVMGDPGRTAEEYAADLEASGTASHDVCQLLGELAAEGFLAREEDRFTIA